MKRNILFSLILSIIMIAPSNAQVGKFLKNVKDNVKKDLLGGSAKTQTAPEPPSACDQAEVVMEIGKYKIDYTELNISVLPDESILLVDKMTDNYYVVKNGVTEGPLKKTDPRVKQFAPENQDNSDNEDGKANAEAILKMCQGYASRSGDKFIINFNGKTYGPYAIINRFAVTKSRDKFAAVVTEAIVVSDADGKKMDQAIKNAKTQQEKMELAMQYSQQMQQNMMNAGGPGSMTPKLVSNVTGVSGDALTAITGQLYGNMKYDEILLVQGDKISDLQGKKIMSFAYGTCEPGSMFISSDNTRSACYSYGTITFNDGKKLSELFNPHLVKVDNKVYIAYMYYSPKRNAIMQCKIPF